MLPRVHNPESRKYGRTCRRAQPYTTRAMAITTLFITWKRVNNKPCTLSSELMCSSNELLTLSGKDSMCADIHVATF